MTIQEAEERYGPIVLSVKIPDDTPNVPMKDELIHIIWGLQAGIRDGLAQIDALTARIAELETDLEAAREFIAGRDIRIAALEKQVPGGVEMVSDASGGKTCTVCHCRWMDLVGALWCPGCGGRIKI